MGTTRQVLAFPQGTGLQMSPTGLTSANHSVVMTFRLLNDTGYNRILKDLVPWNQRQRHL